jgi:hypothetical protein
MTSRLRVLTVNHSCRQISLFAKFGIKHRLNRPYRLQADGKVERSTRTLNQEWEYSRSYFRDGLAGTNKFGFITALPTPYRRWREVAHGATRLPILSTEKQLFAGLNFRGCSIEYWAEGPGICRSHVGLVSVHHHPADHRRAGVTWAH